MSLQNLYVSFTINVTFTDVKLPSKTPSYHHRCWLMNFVLVTIWVFLFSLQSGEYKVHKCYLVLCDSAMPEDFVNIIMMISIVNGKMSNPQLYVGELRYLSAY